MPYRRYCPNCLFSCVREIGFGLFICDWGCGRTYRWNETLSEPLEKRVQEATKEKESTENESTENENYPQANRV